MAPPRRRRKNQEDDTMVERGCLKCCEGCRCSPLTCCMIFSVGGLVAATVALWFLAGVLKGIEPRVDRCEDALVANGIYFGFSEYLGIAGFLVLALLIGICSCCFVAFGCTTSSLPTVVRAISGVCIIVPILVLLFYLGWTAFGTLMVYYCPHYASGLVFVIMLYAYGLVLLLCGSIAFAIVIMKAGKYADEKIGSIQLKT